MASIHGAVCAAIYLSTAQFAGTAISVSDSSGVHLYGCLAQPVAGIPGVGRVTRHPFGICSRAGGRALADPSEPRGPLGGCYLSILVRKLRSMVMTQNTRRELWKILILVLVAGILLGFVAPGEVESPYNNF